MVNINISIKKEAYDFLSRLKRDNKSFSDIILEFEEEKKGIMDLFGCLKDADIDWDKVENNIKEFRKDFNKRLR